MASNLSVFINSLRRVYAVIPKDLQRSVRKIFIGMALLGIVELASIIALTGFFGYMNNPERLLQFPIVKIILESSSHLQKLTEDPRELILWYSLLPIGLIIFKNILSAIISWASAMLSERVAAYVGNRIMERFLYMPFDWHLSAHSSHALTAMQWRFSLGQMLLQTLISWSSMITVCLLFCGLLVYEPDVTSCAVVFMFFIAVLTYRLLRHRIDASSQLASLAQSQENEANMIAISGVRELIIYQQQPVFLDSIRHHVHDGMKPRSFLGISPTIPTWTLESAGFFFIWLATWLLIRVQRVPLQIITEVIFLLALTAWRVLPSLNRVVGAAVTVRALQSTALPCLNYLESLAPLPIEAKILPAEHFCIQHEIVFEHVSYRYPNTDHDALHNICCRIPRGRTIGLVGRSGAGKSTFINILSGLLRPTEGRFLVDGRELDMAELAAYRRQIGYVPQNPYLLSGTIAQNVAFCDWGKTPDMARVRKACQESAIDFLGESCEDIERFISSNGSGLSGGQIQRVSIARALYGDPELLIFDEATSALDQIAEAEVQQAIQYSKGKRINIIAAHRLSTLEICDSILWLDAGHLHAEGDVSSILLAYTSNGVIST